MLKFLDRALVKFSNLYSSDIPLYTNSKGEEDRNAGLAPFKGWSKKENESAIGNRFNAVRLLYPKKNAGLKRKIFSRYCRLMWKLSSAAESRLYMRELHRRFRENDWLLGPPTCYKDDPKFKKYY